MKWKKNADDQKCGQLWCPAPYTKLCTKLAVSESSIALGRLNLAFYFYLLDYLHEIWDTYSSWLWLQLTDWDFSIFAKDLVIVFQNRKNGVKLSLKSERVLQIPGVKVKKTGAVFFLSTLTLSFCDNSSCPSQFVKKLNLTKRGAFFRDFCVSKAITTVHTHKSGVIFHIVPRAFKQTKKVRLHT